MSSSREGAAAVAGDQAVNGNTADCADSNLLREVSGHIRPLPEQCCRFSCTEDRLLAPTACVVPPTATATPAACCSPDKKEKEAAFAEFAAAMDDELKQQAAEEDEEAAEAAQEREQREVYEQG